MGTSTMGCSSSCGREQQTMLSLVFAALAAFAAGFIEPPLQGHTRCIWTPGHTYIYDNQTNPFIATFNSSFGYYTWNAPLREPSGNVEKGVGKWLVPPMVNHNTRSTWTLRSFIGTRISTGQHTSCCCQFMTGG